jgi:formylglycine-generating enzyme required for sulfatase activity
MIRKRFDYCKSQHCLTLLFMALLGSMHSAGQKTDSVFAAYLQPIPGSSFQLKMVPVPAGSFKMGSPETEKNREADEGPQQEVKISAFWMSAFEISRDAFDVYYNDPGIPEDSDVDAISKPSPQYIDFSMGMGKEGGYPVNSMSQYAALMYCRWLHQKTGIFYRLPTEAEWEYACRAGSQTAYFFGDDAADLDKYAWHAGNSDNKFHKAGEKLPNAWGLYDMLGNVLEWTMDHYEAKRLQELGSSADPAPLFNKSRYPKALRGGGFADDASRLRCANRYQSISQWNRRDPQIPKSKWWLTEAKDVGFRIIKPKHQPTASEAKAFYSMYLDN